VGPAPRPPLTGRRRAAEAVLVVLSRAGRGRRPTVLGSESLRADQHAYNLRVARKLEPDLFARDALYRHDPDQLHVPWFLDAHAAVARQLEGDVERARTRSGGREICGLDARGSAATRTILDGPCGRGVASRCGAGAERAEC
jgi:hypothetical protein